VDPTVMQAHRDELYRFVLKRVGNAADAEDIVQEVWLKAYARQASLRHASKLRPWLYQITRNAIVDHYRAQKPSVTFSAELLPQRAQAEEHRAQGELARCLVPLLDQLPATYRQALQLTEFEGVTQREVATRLGLSLSGAKSRVQRARQMLREVLMTCCRVELDRRGGVVNYELNKGCDRC
jgi:RNA polymerase sigma-70 factor (ECF subfamily)